VVIQESVWSLSRTLLFGVYTLGSWFLLKRFWTSDMGNAVIILCRNVPHFVGRVTQSVWAGRVWYLIPVGTVYSAHPPNLHYCTSSIPGCNVQPGRAVDNLPPSSPAVMEENTAIPIHTSVR